MTISLPRQASGPRTIAVIHQGALGDFLIALSPLEGLYRAAPGIGFRFWSKPEHFALIESKPYANAFHPAGGPEFTPFFHPEMWEHAPVPSFLEDAGEVLVFGQKSTRCLVDRLSIRMKSSVHWIQSFPPAGGTEHASRFIALQLETLGYVVADTIAAVPAASEERRAVRAWFRENGMAGAERPVVLHPGSGGRRKIWPLAKWWGLVDWLRRRRGLPVLMVLGPADDHLEGLAEASENIGVRVVANPTLPRLAAFLAESRLYVGNDSGVSHLAAATGIPSVVFFGPTDPRVWAPRGAHVRLIAADWDAPGNLAWDPPFQDPPEQRIRSVLDEFIGGEAGERRAAKL